MKIPAKFFPFAVRQPLWDMAKKYGRKKYSIVAIWDYMYWRSGKKNLFELAEELVCLDLGCDPTTLRAVRRILVAEGWLKKETLRDKGGKWEVRGWTVIANIAATVPKDLGGEDQPPSRDPAVVEPTVVSTSGGKPPCTVSSTLCTPSASPSSCTPSASPSSVPASKSVSKLAEGTETQVEKNKTHRLRLLTEEGPNPEESNPEEFDARTNLIAENLYVPFGTPYITADDMPAVMDIAMESLRHGLDDAQAIHLPQWAKAHKFWTGRTPTYASLAKNMGNRTETGLVAQYRARPEAAKRKPAPQANPNCSRCRGTTYGNPTYSENGKPYCADCMKLPQFRRESGDRVILAGNL